MAFDFGQKHWQADCSRLDQEGRDLFLVALGKAFPDKYKNIDPIPAQTFVVLVCSEKGPGVTYQTNLVGIFKNNYQTATEYDICEFIFSTLGIQGQKIIQQIGSTKLVNSDKGRRDDQTGNKYNRGRIKQENLGNEYCDDHTGNKYHRKIRDIKGRQCMVFDHDRQEYVPAFVDFYSIERACALPGGGITHCAKKVLFCGIRGKGDSLQDLIEARDALTREIESIKTERAEGSCKQD